MIALLALLAAAATDPLAGTWRNAGDSVRIRVAPCAGGGGGESGRGMCGTVISASAKAKADAAKGGTDRLVGTPLFRDFRRGEGGDWAGSVFVPDLGTAVEGTLHLDGRDTLVAEGCLFAGFGCRQQRWTRVGRR